MEKKELNIEFAKAYEISSSTEIKLPPDLMLQLYAYYKQATKGSNYVQPSGNVELRNAFKLNAWFQLSHISENEAKQEYINLVNKHLKKNRTSTASLKIKEYYTPRSLKKVLQYLSIDYAHEGLGLPLPDWVDEILAQDAYSIED